MRPLALLVVVLAAGPAAAQPLIYPGADAESSGARFPRVRRGLQVITDPTLLLSPSSRFASGESPTRYPVLDAAPNVVNLASIGTLTATSVTANALAFGLPPALRLARVALVGPPDVAHNRRETLLWVAEPTLLMIRQRRQARVAAGGPAACGCAPPPRARLFGRR